MAAEVEEIEIYLGDFVPESEFERQMLVSLPQPRLRPVEVIRDKEACECCNRTDRKLWNGVCAWCCP